LSTVAVHRGVHGDEVMGLSLGTTRLCPPFVDRVPGAVAPSRYPGV